MKAFTHPEINLINFSDLLKKFIKCNRFESQRISDFDVMVESCGSLTHVVITNVHKKHKIFFKKDNLTDDSGKDTYKISSMLSEHPNNDDFNAFLWILQVEETKIIFDVMDFNDKMFPKRKRSNF